MKKGAIPVLLNMTSISRSEDGDDQTFQLLLKGELKKATDGYFLRYHEALPDDQGGIASENDVLLTLKPGRVTMNRSGEYATSLVFEKDRRFEGQYSTPYGDMSMAVFATSVRTSLSDTKGSVHLEYQVDMQGNFAGVNILHLEYQADALC